MTIDAASFPGTSALLPCLGAALVIWPRQAETTSGRALGVLAPVGLISYSLYLWHWPVWVSFRIYINGAEPRIREALALAVISIMVSTLSYLFVERPLRKPRMPSKNNVAAGIAASFAIFCMSMFIVRANGLPDRVSAEAYAMRSREAMWGWPCREHVKLGDRDYCGFGAPWATSPRKGLLWGDSHAQHLAPIVDLLARRAGISFIMEDRCPAILGDHVVRRWLEVPHYQTDCAAARKASLRLLGGPDIDYVIIAAAWTTLATNDLYSDRADDPVDHQALIVQGLRNLLAQIQRPGRTTAVVANMTGPGLILTECAIATDAGLVRRQCPDNTMRIDSVGKRAMLAASDDALASAAAANGAVVIRPTDGMCGPLECLTRVNGEFIWMDYSHLRRNLSAATDLTLGERLGFGALLR